MDEEKNKLTTATIGSVHVWLHCIIRGGGGGWHQFEHGCGFHAALVSSILFASKLAPAKPLDLGNFLRWRSH